MLPQNFRLKHKRDFDTLFTEGRFVAGRFMDLKFWRIEPNKYPRRAYASTDLKIGFVVGLKVSKSAVKRNRIKRQMREVIRIILKDNKLKAGYIMAFVAKPAALEAVYSEIEADMSQIISRARLFV